MAMAMVMADRAQDQILILNRVVRLRSWQPQLSASSICIIYLTKRIKFAIINLVQIKHKIIYKGGKMNTRAKWTIGGLLTLFLILGFTVPIKEQVYTEKELYMATEKYIGSEPYNATETYTVDVNYTYIAPCLEQYNYDGCCRPPGVPGNMIGSYQYPKPGDPAYYPYAKRPVDYCEYRGTRPETRTRTVIKYRDVVKTREAPAIRTVTKKRTVPLLDFTSPPN